MYCICCNKRPGGVAFFQGGAFIRGELSSRILPYKICFRRSINVFISESSDESDCERDDMDYSTDYDSPGH